jgi:hypothetical protein
LHGVMNVGSSTKAWYAMPCQTGPSCGQLRTLSKNVLHTFKRCGEGVGSRRKGWLREICRVDILGVLGKKSL